MKTTIIYIIGIASLLFTHCTQPNTTPKDSKIQGLAAPIILNADTTKVFLSDYFDSPFVVDSIASQNDVASFFVDDTLFLLPNENSSVLSNYLIFVSGLPYSIPVFNKLGKTVDLHFKTAKNYKSLAVKGMFNNWSELIPLSMENGIWSTRLKLKKGRYEYKLVADGIEILDSFKTIVSNGIGGFNNLMEVGGENNGETPSIETISFEKNVIKIKTNNATTVFAYWENFRLSFEKAGDIIILKIPPYAKQFNRSHIRVYSANQNQLGNDLLIPLKKGKIITNTSQLNNNDWHSSIMYFMMVDRFADGNPDNNEKNHDKAVMSKARYLGGDLKGITQKIKEGYFKELGINTIWISPITQNPLTSWGQFTDPNTKFSGYHGYWPITSTTVDHRFGNEAELEELLNTAHENGISVLLDYVANHVHKEHSVYQKNPEWFTPLYLPDGRMNTELWDEQRLTTWFDTFMPTLNLEDKRVVNFMVDSALHWITKYDFDGFRHDATKHVSEVFWRTLTQKVKNVNREKNKKHYQIGETYGSNELISSYLGNGLLDGQFDFNLYDKAILSFAKKDESFENLAFVLQASLNAYGHHHLMGNISGNQDKPRFISYADGSLPFDLPGNEYKRIGWKNDIEVADSQAYQKLLMLHLFNLTIPGIPIIYYGDEIGMAGAGDPDNRRMMRFDSLKSSENQLLKKLQELIKMRQNSMALNYGDFKILEVSPTIFKYQRTYFKESVIITLNKKNWNYQIQQNNEN